MTFGYNPKISKWSPYHGAAYAIVESVSKAVALGADYKKIYTSSNIEEANLFLDEFKNKYEKDHCKIVKKAQDFMQYLEPLFELPQEIRKYIYIKCSRIS